MHIIKTAFKESWPVSLDNTILLGNWCIKEDFHDIEKLKKLEVIKYHFDDRKKIESSYKEINLIYNDLLKLISDSLNKLFNKNNDSRYWEIIYGWWLFTYILVIYDRNLSISKVLQKYPNSITNILNPKSYIISHNTRDYLDNIQTDYFNFQIYSSLWKIKNGNVNSIITTSNSNKNLTKSTTLNFKSFLINFLKILFKPLSTQSSLILFKTGFSKKSLLKIIIGTKFKIIPFELYINENIENTKKIDRDLVLRNELKTILNKNKKKEDSFLNLCLDLITEHIPITILEGYNLSSAISKKIFHKSSHLLSSNGFINDHWNILCAEHVKNGSKLINIQHGGGYGIQKFSVFEDYEIRVSDKYVTTGWHRNPLEKFISMPLPFINKSNNRKKNNGKVLYIRNDYSRYIYRLFSHPIGKYAKLYRDSADKFLEQLNIRLLDNTLVRLYERDQAGTYKNFMKKHTLVKYDNSKDFDYQLRNCKIAVSDTNQTTFLQSIALDIPTIIFWNPVSTEIKSDARSIMDSLNKAKILHYTPESAANFLNHNYDSIDKWWMSRQVREVRARFISKYVNLTNDLENDWIRFIETELSE